VIWNPGVGEERNIFVHHLPETNAVASVVRVGSTSPRGWDLLDRLSVQIMTRSGTSNDATSAFERAELIFDAFLETSTDVPKRAIDLGSDWFAHEIDAQRPQSIGLDEKNRALVSMNMQITAGTKPAA